jgi:hypothetical protein
MAFDIVIASRSCGEAIQGCRTMVGVVALDCFVAALLAMTGDNFGDLR